MKTKAAILEAVRFVSRLSPNRVEYRQIPVILHNAGYHRREGVLLKAVRELEAEGKLRILRLGRSSQAWDLELPEKPNATTSPSQEVSKHYNAEYPHIICPVHDPVAVEREINADGWTVGENWSHSDPEQEQPDGRWILYVQELDLVEPS